MPPLVMPWSARNFSSVCTNTSKIALPIPRTSYFASVMHPSCCGNCACAENPLQLDFIRVQRLSRSALRQQATTLFCLSMISAQTRSAFVARENRCPLFRIMLYTAFMIRSFLTVSTGTLASRLLGFARDAMIAALLGTGAVADAFLVAFQLVNVVRRLLTEGALNAALVPAWLRVREAEGAVAAAAFAGRVLGTVSAALIVAAALIGLLMSFVMTVVAPGFAGQATLRLAVDDARLMLAYLAFAGPVTVMMALLNAQARFALTAFSPLLF